MIDTPSLEQTGFWYTDHLISDELNMALFQRIHELFETQQMRAALVGKNAEMRRDESERGDFISWIDTQEKIGCTAEFLMRIGEVQQHFNRTHFLGLKSIETHFAVYPNGTFYKPHRDVHRQGSSRVVSFVHYLNPEWEPGHGGELVIYEDSGTAHTIKPIYGRTIFFLSEMLHEVLPTSSLRRSITGWMHNRYK